MPKKTRLKKGVFHFRAGASDLQIDGDLLVSGAATITGALTQTGLATGPVKRANRAVTATVDGLTTGLILNTDTQVTVTSNDANKIVTLPAAEVGLDIVIYVPAVGCEIRTPAASGVKINNVVGDGTQELAVGANEHCRAVCVSTTEWKINRWTQAGAATTAVPD